MHHVCVHGATCFSFHVASIQATLVRCDPPPVLHSHGFTPLITKHHILQQGKDESVESESWLVEMNAGIFPSLLVFVITPAGLELSVSCF